MLEEHHNHMVNLTYHFDQENAFGATCCDRNINKTSQCPSVIPSHSKVAAFHSYIHAVPKTRQPPAKLDVFS